MNRVSSQFQGLLQVYNIWRKKYNRKACSITDREPRETYRVAFPFKAKLSTKDYNCGKGEKVTLQKLTALYWHSSKVL